MRAITIIYNAKGIKMISQENASNKRVIEILEKALKICKAKAI